MGFERKYKYSSNFFIMKEKSMIKPLNCSKIDEVMSIWLKTNITAHPFISEAYWFKNYDVVKDQYMPNAATYIYEEKQVIKGFISIIDQSFVGALFVLDDEQGQGIGKKLLNYCQSLYSSLELGVYKENIKAVHFYKHCGFVKVKEQSNADSGFIEYIMRWVK